MFKKYNVLVFAILLSFSSFGQRYLTKVFDSINVNYNLLYGYNFDCNNLGTNLLFDLYQPKGDTASNIPLIILAHGGSFIQGSKSSSDMVALCTDLAKRGYIVASIDYRIKISVTSGNTLTKEFEQAVWRGTQDLRAAVRFFKKHVADGNTLKIDTTNFFAGGTSAGGIMGLHLAFLDTYAEFNSLGLDTSFIGGIDGNSGNQGYDWHVKGIISLCGALGDVRWMNNNKNVSLCFMHGDKDNTVPYKSDYYQLIGQNVAFLQGGFSADSAARKLGMNTRLFTFNGADHVPFVGNSTYMDTVTDYVSRYLYKQVTGNIPANLNFTKNLKSNLLIYPNPANDFININLENELMLPCKIEISDLFGKTVLVEICNENIYQINTTHFNKGLYFMNLSSQNQHFNLQFLIH